MKYIFTNGHILDGTKDMKVLDGHSVLVEDDKITGIVKGNTVPDGFKEINLEGKYLMPGLINMHVHLAGNGKPQKKQKDNEKTVKMLMSNPLSRKITYKVVSNFAKIELMSGVTTIRTVGGIAHYDSKLRDEILKRKVIGPRIVASNEGISVPHGHMAGSVAIAAHNNEEALALVDKAKSQNVDLIKLMITGGVLDAKEKGVPGELKMPPEMVKAVCDRAHQLGYKVAAHVESSEGVRVALENGVDSIEHGAKLDDEMIALFKEKKAFLCTTISPALPFALFDPSISNVSEIEKYNGELVFNGIIDCAKQALENDIPVVLGNDVGCPWVSQYDFWRELYYFHKYIGVSNRFALYTATSLASKYVGLENITGSIDVGKDADMIVVSENPLDDLKALRYVEKVFTRGKLIDYPKVKINKTVETELDKYL